MNIQVGKCSLKGSIVVPGSKSHTIRALLLASLGKGTSVIRNPLPSADCLSTAAAVPLIGAKVNLNLSHEGEAGNQWIVEGAGDNIHLPEDVVNVGNSGSLLYFLAPIAAVFSGWSVFTGDESIRKRPVNHLADAINQLGGFSQTSIPDHNGCPLVIKGPVTPGTVVTAGEVSSQYISGLMMSAVLMNGKLEIHLSNPKETPYLTMTQKWLEKVGAKCFVSSDFKKIEVSGPVQISAFDETIPSDWEGVAFPLIAGILTNSTVTIENIDGSGTQGDEAIVEILSSIGANLDWNKENRTLTVIGGEGKNRLSTQNLEGGELHVKMSSFPDAICALAVAACFTKGKVILEDAEVCRRKETDRLKVLKTELSKLGAHIEEKEDALIINGGKILHGGTVESYGDHRMAMALYCLGLALPEGEVLTVKDAECCSVSFPKFFELMENCLNAKHKVLC